MNFLPPSAMASSSVGVAEREVGDEDQEPTVEDEANPLAAQLKSLIRQGKIDVDEQGEDA
jgi:hypothetical protein